MAAAPRKRTGPSREGTLAAAITIQLENLLKALEATEKAITEKMKEMGMAPFTGPILQAWRKEVAKTFTKESKRMAKAFEQIVENEATQMDPALKIQEAEAQLAKVTKQLEEAQRLSETEPTPQPQIIEEAENRAMLKELHEKVENLTGQLQAREEELNRLYILLKMILNIKLITSSVISLQTGLISNTLDAVWAYQLSVQNGYWKNLRLMVSLKLMRTGCVLFNSFVKQIQHEPKNRRKRKCQLEW